MKIDDNVLILDEKGFDFNDDFKKVDSFVEPLLNEVKFNSAIKNRKYIYLKEIVFQGFLFKSTMHFSKNKLVKIKLVPCFEKYLSEEEIQSHDADPVIKVAENMLSEFRKSFKKISDNEHERVFAKGDIKIHLFFTKDYESFDVYLYKNKKKI